MSGTTIQGKGSASIIGKPLVITISLLGGVTLLAFAYGQRSYGLSCLSAVRIALARSSNGTASVSRSIFRRSEA